MRGGFEFFIMAAQIAALLGQAALNIGVNELNRLRTNSDAKSMAYLNNNLNRQNVVDSALLTKVGYQNAGLSTAAMSSPMTVSASNVQPAVSSASPPDVSSLLSNLAALKVSKAQARLLNEQAEEQQIKNDQMKYFSDVIEEKQTQHDNPDSGSTLGDVSVIAKKLGSKKYKYNDAVYRLLQGVPDSDIAVTKSSNDAIIAKNKVDMSVFQRQIDDKKLLDKIASMPSVEFDKLKATLDGLRKSNKLADIDIYIKNAIKDNEISLSNYEVVMARLAQAAAQNDLDHDIFTQIDKLFDKKDFGVKDVFKFLAVMIGSVLKGAGSAAPFISSFRGRR